MFVHELHDLLRCAAYLALLYLFMAFIGMAVVVAFRSFWLSEVDLIITPFLGLSGCIFFAELWSLLVPIRHSTIFVLAVICAILILSRFKEFLDPLRRFGSGVSWIPVALSVAFLLVVAFNSLTPIAHYDDGFYHLNAIRWIKEYRVVPGLANLNDRRDAPLPATPYFNPKLELRGAKLEDGFRVHK
jgi:hypothetical protein